MFKRLTSALVTTLVLALWPLAAVAQAPFYAGKTITIIAGTKAGDVYDTYARLFAEHLPKYIPGNPNIIVQNMPGAGSMIAANQLYNIAKPDGLTLGMISSGLYFDQLLGAKEVQFDWARYGWIGSPVRNFEVLTMRADTPYKSIEDIQKAAQAPRCGTTGMTGSQPGI